MENKISAIVLHKNGEEKMQKCLASLVWCDEIVIVDDDSDERSFALLKGMIPTPKRNLKVQIFRRKLNADFSQQRNFGLEKAKNSWVLFVDTDEIVSPALAREIKGKINKKDCQGYYLFRQDVFLGRKLLHGETANVRLLRLSRRNLGQWQGKVHEKWLIAGKVGQLENPLFHYPHANISSFLTKINRYTDIVAQSWKEEERGVSFWEIIFFPAGKFFQNYFWRLGFLDGTAGFIMAMMMSFHSFLGRSKLWLLNQRQK